MNYYELKICAGCIKKVAKGYVEFFSEEIFGKYPKKNNFFGMFRFLTDAYFFPTKYSDLDTNYENRSGLYVMVDTKLG